MLKLESWNYVGVAQKSTLVTHSCVGNFTARGDINLVIGKCMQLEIHRFTDGGNLELLLDAPIYGRIASLILFRPREEEHDLLFLLTERCMAFILQWDSQASQLVTRYEADYTTKITQPVYNKQIGIIDPYCTVIGLHLNVGHFQVTPLNSKGELEESFDFGIVPAKVLDLTFLHDPSMLTIVVLYEESDMERHLRAYDIDLHGKSYKDSWTLKIANDATLLIPMQNPSQGIIVVAETSINYRNNSNMLKSIEIKQVTSVQAYDKVPINGNKYIISDRLPMDGNKYIIGDHLGFIYSLDIIIDDDREGVDIKLHRLGETSIAKTISYIYKDIIYVGSEKGDSQVIKLNNLHSGINSTKNEILHTYPNIGPILDMCKVFDDEREDQKYIVTCSGASKDGSLRIVRHAIDVNEQESIQIRGITGIWPLKASLADQHDRYIILSFVNGTRMLEMNSNNELEQIESDGFDSEVETIFCQNVAYDQFVQVTESSLRLISASSRMLLSEWSPSVGEYITVATALGSKVLLAIGEDLHSFEIGEGSINDTGFNHKFANDISCLAITPNAHFVAVGTWTDNNIRILALDRPNPSVEEKPDDCMTRSLMFCEMQGILYLVCALGNGMIITYQFNGISAELSKNYVCHVGTKPAVLSPFKLKNETCILAASDPPTIIYSEQQLLRSKYLATSGVIHICYFNTPNNLNCLVFSKKDKTFGIGYINENFERQMSIKTVPMGEHVRRICHQKETGTFAICTIQCHVTEQWGEIETRYVRVLDDKNFKVVSSFQLEPTEYGCSVVSCSFTNDNNVYYCVGTGYAVPEQEENSKGRILVFKVEDDINKLKLVFQKETNGCVYSLCAFDGKLLASVNEFTRIYAWADDDSQDRLYVHCELRGRKLGIQVEAEGNHVLVSDLFKSITLLEYMSSQDELLERVHDFNTRWMAAATFMEEDTFVGSEFETLALFIAKRRMDDRYTSLERRKLEVPGIFHLGDTVNRFIRGSFSISGFDIEIQDVVASAVFGTPTGSIGVVISLKPETFKILLQLQDYIENRKPAIASVGELSHRQWRSVRTDRGFEPAANFIDGNFIQHFLSFSPEERQSIATQLNLEHWKLYVTVEQLSRLH